MTDRELLQLIADWMPNRPQHFLKPDFVLVQKLAERQLAGQPLDDLLAQVPKPKPTRTPEERRAAKAALAQTATVQGPASGQPAAEEKAALPGTALADGTAAAGADDLI